MTAATSHNEHDAAATPTAGEETDGTRNGGSSGSSIRQAISGIAIVVLIGVAVAWLSGWFETKIPPGSIADARQTIDAETVVVSAITSPNVEWASGTVEAAQRTTVASRIVARIDEIRVTAGDQVLAGDTLIVLDARDLNARVQQAKDAHAAAVARLDLANVELKRADELLKQGVATRQRHEQALSEQRVAEAEVRRAQQLRNEAEAALSYSVIRATAPGRIIDRLAEPGDTVTPGGALLRLYDPTSLRVAAPVRESLAVKLRIGDELQVDLPSVGMTLQAPIAQIVPYAEPGARTMLVKVRLPEDTTAVAGMFARIAVPAGKSERSIIPVSAIHTIGQLKFVYVLADGKLEQRLVTTGEPHGQGRVEVLSGISAGEEIVADWVAIRSG